MDNGQYVLRKAHSAAFSSGELKNYENCYKMNKVLAAGSCLSVALFKQIVTQITFHEKGRNFPVYKHLGNGTCQM